MILVEHACIQIYIYIYLQYTDTAVYIIFLQDIHLEPKWPLSWLEKALFGGIELQI